MWKEIYRGDKTIKMGESSKFKTAKHSCGSYSRTRCGEARKVFSHITE
jgi:hypothetical protein